MLVSMQRYAFTENCVLLIYYFILWAVSALLGLLAYFALISHQDALTSDGMTLGWMLSHPQKERIFSTLLYIVLDSIPLIYNVSPI